MDDPQRTDHIAKIARAEVEGHRLDREEITAFCGLLFIAGGETTDKAIANMWFNLLSRPELIERSGGRSITVGQRFQRNDAAHLAGDHRRSLHHRTGRVVRDRDSRWRPGAREHGGGSQGRVRLRRPGHVRPSPQGSASDQRASIGRFHRTGPSRATLGFGMGKHFCVGYELARTEAIIGSNLLLDRCGRFAIADGAAPYVSLVNAFQATFDLILSIQ